MLSFVGAFGAMGVSLALSLVLPQATAFSLGIALIIIPLMYADLSLVVRRFHDVGLSGWWVLLAMVPAALIFAIPLGYFSFDWVPFILLPINLAFFAVLLIVPGNKAENRYGSPNIRLD